eukprot:1832392-Amphidinium_carterae.1
METTLSSTCCCVPSNATSGRQQGKNGAHHCGDTAKHALNEAHTESDKPGPNERSSTTTLWHTYPVKVLAKVWNDKESLSFPEALESTISLCLVMPEWVCSST